MKLTEVIAIWEELHVKDTGDIGYCDFEKAVEKVVDIESDISSNQPFMSRFQRLNSSSFDCSAFFHLARKYAEEADELQKQLQNEPRLKHATINELLAALTASFEGIKTCSVIVPRF